eukprot:m.151204 g.151204  ORF g.151204 m.151204 type:complete len:55 (+) comp38576_c0_seq5:714-878(+)
MSQQCESECTDCVWGSSSVRKSTGLKKDDAEEDELILYRQIKNREVQNYKRETV